MPNCGKKFEKRKKMFLDTLSYIYFVQCFVCREEYKEQLNSGKLTMKSVTNWFAPKYKKNTDGKLFSRLCTVFEDDRFGLIMEEVERKVNFLYENSQELHVTLDPDEEKFWIDFSGGEISVAELEIFSKKMIREVCEFSLENEFAL